jgi:hypothetical protein
MPRHHTSPCWKRGQGGDFGIRVVDVDGDPKSKPLPDLPAHDPSPAALASERSTNRFKAPSGQIERARELLEAAGLGHLRPDKSWRPRSWQDRLAAIPFPEDKLVEGMAKAIYDIHAERPLHSPHERARVWENQSENVREWVRAQARTVLAYLRSLEKSR